MAEVLIAFVLNWLPRICFVISRTDSQRLSDIPFLLALHMGD
jgi:hypothetical protein